MKNALIVILFIVIGYFVWRFVVVGDPLVFMTKDDGKKRVTGIVKEIKPNTAIIIEIDNDSSKNKIFEFNVDRSAASQMGMTAPEGFHEELLSLSKGEENDREAVEFVEKYNRENVRYIGEFQLAPDVKSLIIIPVKDTSRMNGRITFQYSKRLGLGSTISYFSVDLTELATREI